MSWKTLIPEPIARVGLRARSWLDGRWYRKPEGHRGIRKLGHREYVGGLWDEMGKLQFEFLVAQGLKPADVLVDVGCGSLRGGVHFIKYLEPGNYLGIEKEPELLELGVADELGQDVLASRRPELVASSSFEFERFSKKPNFALAQSLFTHLTPEHITLCMDKLRAFAGPGSRFFATFFERRGEDVSNPGKDHDHNVFRYSTEQMRAFGEEHGWRFHYIGDWEHPRGQIMVEYLAH